MRPLKTLFSLIILAFLMGCTSSGGTANTVLCDAGKATASVVATGISTALSCSNVAAITATLQTKLQATSICQATSSTSAAFTQKSVVGNLICPPVINSLFSGGLSQIPPEWGCTGGATLSTLQATLIATCEKSI